MKQLAETSYSVLDLSPIRQGGNAAESFRNGLDLAQHAERWGYTRFWVAEHHNLPGVASAATSILIGHIAGGTSTLRVGAGGIMLPNHAPLVIAEQFGTLESLYPGRIDLGLGRAPGGDQNTARALRRYLSGSADNFPGDLLELMSYFSPAEPKSAVHAVPGEGLKVPIWLLGSSDFSAALAAELGLPFAFASHFAPDLLLPALALYRENFKPSDRLAEPRAMVGVNVVAADTDAEAQYLFTSLQQQALNMIRGRPAQLPPPVDSMEGRWNPTERAHVEQRTRVSAVGSVVTVRERLTAILEVTRADELIFTAHIYDHAARLRSFELASVAIHEAPAAH
ncbi:MAG TPA: LLM class flavin-dependent oxidoreductase [Planctomycetaceae bacterium]|nr:LLM class flavin-dependent oxidoreductase [Planctomycetaceae bacterium]